MNNQTLKFNNNEIEVIKTKKGYDIKINCDKSADVYVNDECIYASYDKEEYKYIPINMREFIKTNSDWMEFYKESQELAIDFNLNGEELSMYIPSNKTKLISVRYTITDPLEDVLEYVEGYFSNDENQELQELQNKITTIYNDMLNGLRILGFELFPSHSMGDMCWGWQDIRFMAKDFNEELLIKVSKVIFEYDNDLNKFLKEYKILN